MCRACVVALLLAGCGGEASRQDSGLQLGGNDAGCSCLEPGKATLSLCSAGAQQVQTTAATGGACQTSGLQVQLVQEGSCHITVTFKDNTTAAVDVTVTRVTGDCCPGLHLDTFRLTVTVPYSGCPGSCGNDGGC